jgi:hypothetical protein
LLLRAASTDIPEYFRTATKQPEHEFEYGELGGTVRAAAHIFSPTNRSYRRREHGFMAAMGIHNIRNALGVWPQFGRLDLARADGIPTAGADRACWAPLQRASDGHILDQRTDCDGIQRSRVNNVDTDAAGTGCYTRVESIIQGPNSPVAYRGRLPQVDVVRLCAPKSPSIDGYARVWRWRSGFTVSDMLTGTTYDNRYPRTKSDE